MGGGPSNSGFSQASKSSVPSQGISSQVATGKNIKSNPAAVAASMNKSPSQISSQLNSSPNGGVKNTAQNGAIASKGNIPSQGISSQVATGKNMKLNSAAVAASMNKSPSQSASKSVMPGKIIPKTVAVNATVSKGSVGVLKS